tara:strand:+ start:327 stop:1454 length:1128 start_codon:yes stop_codon:yes gene_type:complete
MEDKLKVYMSGQDFNKMIVYARSTYEKYKTEVSGYCPVFIDDDGKMTVGTPSILTQECSGSNTTLDKEAIVEYVDKTAKKYRELLPNKLMFCWWHSHHTMKAFWSGTDSATIKEYAEKGPSLAIVVNNDGEYKADYSVPVKINGNHIKIVSFDVNIVIDYGIETPDVSKEIDEKVSVKKFTKWEEYKGMQQGCLFDDELGYSSYLSGDGAPLGGYTSEEALMENINAKEALDDKKDDRDIPEYIIEEEIQNVERGLSQKGKKPLKEKSLNNVGNLLGKPVNNDDEKKKQQKLIIRNIEQAIEGWHTFSNGSKTEEEHLKYITDLIRGLQQQYNMKLHVPSQMDTLSGFNDLLVREEIEGVNYESAYSEISKHLQH